jgi:hypothetical protein
MQLCSRAPAPNRGGWRESEKVADVIIGASGSILVANSPTLH